MKLELKKKPTGVTVIEGFPGFGLVGTIATGFLIDHLKCERIGRFYFEDGPATIAIHEGEVVDPIGIFYNKEHNLVIIHAITSASGIEWRSSEVVLEACKAFKAKELIAVEGVGNPNLQGEEKVFYYTKDIKKERTLIDAGALRLKEGIILGVTSALLLKADLPLTCIFAEATTNMPDSKASANVIQILDQYLGLDVDYKPLLKQAALFEAKLKGIIEQSSKVQDMRDRKALNYVG